MTELNQRIIEIRNNMDLERSKFVSFLLDSIRSLTEKGMGAESETLLVIKIFNLLLAQYKYRHSFQKLLSHPFFIELDPADACCVRLSVKAAVCLSGTAT